MENKKINTQSPEENDFHENEIVETVIEKAPPFYRFSQLFNNSWLGHKYARLQIRIVKRLERWDSSASRKEKWLFFWCFTIIGLLMSVSIILIPHFSGRHQDVSGLQIKHVTPSPATIKTEQIRKPEAVNAVKVDELIKAADTTSLSDHDLRRINEMADFAMRDTSSLGEFEKRLSQQKN